MDFGNILGKIQTKSSTVAINISAKSVMEVMEIDKNGIINSYANVPIQYNNFTKELENVYDFQSALKQAFSDLKLRQGRSNGFGERNQMRMTSNNFGKGRKNSSNSSSKPSNISLLIKPLKSQ